MEASTQRHFDMALEMAVNDGAHASALVDRQHAELQARIDKLEGVGAQRIANSFDDNMEAESAEADEDDIYARVDETERTAIVCEETVESHIKKLFPRTWVLDRRADSVDEAFESTLGRFDYKAKALNTQMMALQEDGRAILSALDKSNESKEAKETSSPFQEAGPATQIISKCSAASHSERGVQAHGGTTGTMPFGSFHRTAGGEGGRLIGVEAHAQT